MATKKRLTLALKVPKQEADGGETKRSCEKLIRVNECYNTRYNSLYKSEFIAHYDPLFTRPLFIDSFNLHGIRLSLCQLW